MFQICFNFWGDTYQQFEGNFFIEWAEMCRLNAFLSAETDMFYTQIQKEIRKHNCNTIIVN